MLANYKAVYRVLDGLKYKLNYLSYTLIFAVLNMGAIVLVFGFKKYGDSEGYIEMIKWMLGYGKIDVIPIYYLRPLSPLLALPFNFIGEGAGLVIQNIVFYLLSALLIFKIIELLFKNSRQAFWGSIFFVTATPVLEVGLSYLVDTGVWFFYLLSIYLTLKFFESENKKYIGLNGLASGIGFLLKESGGIGSIFFGIRVLIEKGFTFIEKLLKILKFAAFFLLPVLALQVIAYKYLDVTIVEWYFFVMLITGDREDTFFMILLRHLGQLFRIIGILWPLIFIGLWYEFSHKNWDRIKIYFALLPSSFSFFLWATSAGARSVFIFAPLGILLASLGWSVLEAKMSKKTRTISAIGFLSLLVIINYTFSILNPRIDFFEKVMGLLEGL